MDAYFDRFPRIQTLTTSVTAFFRTGSSRFLWYLFPRMNLDFEQLALQFVPFMAAVVFHEFAHGWMANRWGDSTALRAGRLTLNPAPHIDPFGTVIFPMISMLGSFPILFGWARPVPIDPGKFKKYRPGLFWVSFAGPLMNVVLAIVSALVLMGMRRFVPETFSLFYPLHEMARVSVLMNVALAVFNLLPLPPLDGSKMIEAFLPYNATRAYESFAQYSFYIFLALMMTGALRFLLIPAQWLAQAILIGAATVFGF
jgi:Zn-dependent protease